MFLKQFFVEGLAHSSYLVGAEGVGAVIDPRRDVDIYLDEAKEQGLGITHIIETHLHADFVSGHLELAQKTGAKVYVPKAAGTAYEHVPLKQGDEIDVGSLRMRVIETPGHTPEHVSLIVSDLTRTEEPWLVFTGDTLFVGDVGRPDLFGEEKAKELAGRLYQSLHDRLAALPDYVEVYPAHGEGSLCGRSLSGKRHSTIGYERKFNYAFKPTTKEEFRETILKDMPLAPGYFQRTSEINRKGPRVLGGLPQRRAVLPEQAERLLNDGNLLLDVRTPEAFGGVHIQGAYNIWFSPMISTWAGWVLPYEQPILLLLEKEEQWEEVVRQLIRVGLDEIAGYVDEGIEAWLEAGLPTSHLPQLSIHELKDMLAGKEEPIVLDVRTDSEYREGHIAGAVNIHAGQIKDRFKELGKTKPIAIICRTAHRSSIAGSILKQHGFQCLYNVSGGMTAWHNAGYEVTV
jgi:glyoxylase-like metal-dependent hydrolase (beta-lactamase superfamily II)/rhodanese-related sulfurtransferase